MGWVEGRLKGGGRGRRNLERGKRREARRIFFHVHVKKMCAS